MEPSNSALVLVRNPNGRYTDAVGLFRREDVSDMELDFIRVLHTNQGLIDEYELIRYITLS